MNKLFFILMLLNQLSLCMDSKPSSVSAEKDDTIVFDEEDITYQTIKTTYFKGTPGTALRLKPYLRRAMAQSSDSPSDQRMQNIVTLATNEALEAQQKEMDKRWTKKRSACCATVTGICSSIITAGVTLAIHFTKKEC